MNSTSEQHTIHNLLVNDDFINYVLNPNLILKEMWEEYLSLHPEDIPLMNEARRILLGELNPEELTNEEAYELEKNILNKCGLTVS